MFAVRVCHQDAGDLSSDAGELLLTLSKDSSLSLLAMLFQVLRPLSLLNKSLQPETNDIITAMQHAKAVTATWLNLRIYIELNKFIRI